MKDTRDRREYSKKRYYANVDESRRKARESHKRNRERNLIAGKVRRDKLRMQALVAYSGETPQCACCGEKEIRFLCIDHINGGGQKERKANKGGGGWLRIRLKERGYPPGYQVLCHNCNMAKGFYGKCPHNEELIRAVPAYQQSL